MHYARYRGEYERKIEYNPFLDGNDIKSVIAEG